jgi:hypothetical protein
VCSTNFVFKARRGSIQIFGVFRVQTRAYRHGLGLERAPRHPRRPRCHASRGRAPSKAAPSPGCSAPRDALKSPRHVPTRRSCRTARTHHAVQRSVRGSLPCVHAYRGRRSTTVGIFDIHSSRSFEVAYLNAARPSRARHSSAATCH